VNAHRAEGVLLTGVYGSGKSSVAEEIAYLLEQRGERYALLDLDYLSWAGTGADDRVAEFELMLQNLGAVAANYQRAGIRLFARLTVPLPVIERRLAGDVSSGRRDDLREAASSIAASAGDGVEDVAISNDRPLGLVAQDVLTFLRWV
jgi:hypothetical protein